MRPDPKADPKSEADPAPALSIVADPQNIIELAPAKADAFEHAFDFQGKGYKLYKRNQSRDGQWYCKFEFAKRLWKKSLETNIASVAEHNAKRWIGEIRSEKWENVEKLKAKQSFALVEDILPVYKACCGLGDRVRDNNIWAFKKVVRMGLGLEEGKEGAVPITKLDRMLVVDFENAMVTHYVLAALDDEGKKLAKAKALRVARSCMNQARSLFNRKVEMVAQYERQGLKLPANLDGFMKCKLQGKLVKENYYAPPREQVEAALDGIAKLEKTDPQVFKAFWLAVGVGLRRGEIGRAMCEHFVMREQLFRKGKIVKRVQAPWYSGGVGKDSKQIEVPVQERAWKALKNYVEGKKGPVLDPDPSMQFARRIGVWMKMQGWNTDKKLHELRAYVGSLIYEQNPVAAKEFMRHKSISVTENHYGRYVKVQTPSVL